MKFKRLIANLIDTFIVSMIASVIVYIPIFGYDIEEQQRVNNEYFEYIESIGSGEIDEDTVMNLTYDNQKAGVPLSIVTLGMTFLYFGIYGFMTNGETIGKKMMKIKIVPAKGKNLNISLFMLREIILLGIIFNGLGIAVTLLIDDVSLWFNVYNTITRVSALVTLIIYAFIIFREDERGLHDLIGQTKVISTDNTKIKEIANHNEQDEKELSTEEVKEETVQEESSEEIDSQDEDIDDVEEIEETEEDKEKLSEEDEDEAIEKDSQEKRRKSKKTSK